MEPRGKGKFKRRWTKVIGFELSKGGATRNWWVLAQLLYSPKGNGRHSPRLELFKQGDRAHDVKENPGSWYCQGLGGQARPRAHLRNIHVKQE